MLSLIVSEILSTSGFGVHFGLSIIIRIARLPQVCRWNFDDICHIFGDISISGFDSHIAISGCPSSSKLLSLRSPWPILPGSQLKRDKFDVFLRTPGSIDARCAQT